MCTTVRRVYYRVCKNKKRKEFTLCRQRGKVQLFSPPVPAKKKQGNFEFDGNHKSKKEWDRAVFTTV